MALRTTALLLLLTVALASARKCYQCHGCEEGERGNPVVCSSLQNFCRKVVLGSRIEKGCSTSATCSLADAEKSLYDIFSGISSSISGNDKSSYDTENAMIHCCEDDYCNSQTTTTASLLLVLPTFLLTALLQ